MKGTPHPSGRPIRRTRVVERPIWRIPNDGPETPRLRVKEGVPAIGFIQRFDTDEDAPDA